MHVHIIQFLPENLREANDFSHWAIFLVSKMYFFSKDRKLGGGEDESGRSEGKVWAVTMIKINICRTDYLNESSTAFRNVLIKYGDPWPDMMQRARDLGTPSCI